MPDPFGILTATLAGTAPPAMPTKAEATAARLSRAAAVLRNSGDPELAAVAGAFEQWLASGGDLARMLGAKARRGKRDELPHNQRRRQAMADELRALVADENGRVTDPRQAGKVLAALLRRMPVAARVIRERTGVDRVPTSEKSLVSLIRGTE
jgi:hypothetical protein